MPSTRPYQTQEANPIPKNRALFYGGSWHEPLGGYKPTFNPANGEILAECASTNAEDVDRAVSAAHAAFRQWQQTSPAYRAGLLRKLADLLRANASELALIDSLNCGNPIKPLMHDVQLAADQIEYFAGLASEVKGETLPTQQGMLNMTIREPLGVCARIVAYNHPLMFIAAKLAAPIAAGNTVVMKPPEQAPLSSYRLAELAGDLFPPGVINIVSGAAECGAVLVGHPRTAMVTLIGSVATGRAVTRGAADRMKKVLLELGGKNALVVYPDADVDRAIRGAVQGMNFAWCGQSCGSTSRLFVHADLYDRVVDGVIEASKAFRPGIPSDPATTMGSLISRSQHEKVLHYIALGREQGARLLTGGGPPSEPALRAGYFVEPTIFGDVTSDMRIAREEIFGPVLSILRWSDEARLFEEVNDVEYGLTAGIFTRDLSSAMRAIRRIDAGYIWVNNSSAHFTGLPFGGVKQSGIGREECLDELLAFTEQKSVHVSF